MESEVMEGMFGNSRTCKVQQWLILNAVIKHENTIFIPSNSYTKHNSKEQAIFKTFFLKEPFYTWHGILKAQHLSQIENPVNPAVTEIAGNAF